MMYSSDHEILTTASGWLKENRQVILITVLKTWGSSPRPVGSLMIIRDDGLHAGSVSGGCVEEELILRVKQNQLAADDETGTATTLSFGSNSQQASRMGLPCGGRLELLIETLENAKQIDTILNSLSKGQLLCRRVCLDTGEISLHPATVNNEFSYAEQTINKVFGPAWHIFIIGAGHLSQYVVQMAMMLGYKVSVCDPREEYQQAWPVKDIKLVTMMPDDAFKQLDCHQRCIVLSLSHDPKLDDMALMEALTVNCFYVGALGSKKNNDKRRLRLKQMGISDKQLKQLHAPVGLAIGSHAPAEIAISIMAEITSLRNVKNDVQQIETLAR